MESQLLALKLEDVCFSHARHVHDERAFQRELGWLGKLAWKRLRSAGLARAVRSKQELKILDHVNLELRHGEILCIGGPSGQGKSTLLRIVAGLEKPSQGKLEIFGEEVKRFDPLSIAKRGVGFVFQNSALLSNLTVYENIAMPLRYHQYGSEADIQDLVNRALKMMMISDFKESYPYSLSLGMRRRVAVARSWALDSRILLLDEPTAGLDNNNRRNLLSLIDNMRELYKTSILMVTHDFRIAHELNCRITFLKDRELTPPVHYDELPDSTDPFIRALTQADM